MIKTPNFFFNFFSILKVAHKPASFVAWENIFIEKTGRRRLTIESARRIKQKQKELVDSILQKGDIVVERINKDLLAGIKIIINESKQFDGSMRKKLQNIL